MHKYAPNVQPEEELIDVLFAISVIAQRMAERLLKVSQSGNPTHGSCPMFIRQMYHERRTDHEAI